MTIIQKNILIITSSVLVSFLFVALITHSATTISTNINTGGTLTVSGNSTLSGDLTVDTNTLYVDSTNNRVGIGTTTPNWDLQIAGTRPFLTLSDTAAGTDSKHWFMSSQGGNFYIGTTTDSYATTTGYQLLTILNNGKVGIGTTTPNGNLLVWGGTSGTELIIDSLGSADFNLKSGGDTSANWAISALTTGELRIFDNLRTKEYFRIDTAGQIGIGDAGPDAFLDISSSTASTLFRVDDGGDNETTPFIINGIGNVGIGTSTPNWKLQVVSTTPFLVLSDTAAGNNLKHWYLSSQGGRFYIGTTTDSYATTTGYQFFTALNNGNVGIGTSTPATLFQTSSGANATTTMSIGELGLSTSKSCINMNTATGAPASMYIGSAGTLVVELIYCR